ncbi:alveolar soft part sarcoma chromosome candidate 1-like [Moniliophthora roreri]|nr:alveolar soft part sarcoma chromosome candidate 1-like [Moniliophthora roreri]
MSDDQQPPAEPPPAPIESSATPLVKEEAALTTPAFKVFRPPATSSAPPPQLPDEFYNPTASDLKLAQEQLAARTQALTNAPLQLRATREAAEKLKTDRWPETRIRVKFPDRTQLEKTFPSTDKIKSIYAFVRNSLTEDVKPIKFILYQPPRRDLKVSDVKVKNLSLAELQLAPSSVLLLRFEDESLNGTTVPAPLAPEVLAVAEDLPAPPPEIAPQPEKVESKAKVLASAFTSGSGEKKIPKWLKLGKK